MAEHPVEISSVTPYGTGPEPRVPQTSLPAVLGASWIAAALLAIAASFARVYSLTFGTPGTNGSPGITTRFAIDGWGRTSITHNPATALSTTASPGGARWGVLFCLAAAAMLLGWLLQMPTSSRWHTTHTGLKISGWSCVFLAGVVSGQIIATLPAANGAPGTFHFGTSPLLGTVSSVLGLLIWSVQHQTQRQTERSAAHPRAGGDQGLSAGLRPGLPTRGGPPE